MFRFIAFIFGIVAGFAAALVVLPFPGKTFFNRMSKLPSGTKKLIDNSISLFSTLVQFSSSSSSEFGARASEVIKRTSARIRDINNKYASSANQQEQQADTKAAKV